MIIFKLKKLMRWIRILNGRFQADPVDALHPKSGNKKEKFYFIVSTLEGRSNRNRIKVKLSRLNDMTPEGQAVLKVRSTRL